MNLIDTHCHLYLKEFENDLDDIIQKAVENKVDKIFLPAIDSETNDDLIRLAERSGYQGCNFFPMAGLHPCSVKENFLDELETVKSKLEGDVKFYGVGETGLDFYWDLTYKEQQVVSFETQIKWSIDFGLPVVVHSRNSTSACIESVEKFNGKAKGIFHCFSGTLEEAQKLIELGFYLGIGGVVTYKNSDLKDIIREIELSDLVLETDSPYLPPVPYRGKRNEPSYLNLVCKKVAEVLEVTEDEVADVTSHNAAKVFQLKD